MAHYFSLDATKTRTINKIKTDPIGEVFTIGTGEAIGAIIITGAINMGTSTDEIEAVGMTMKNLLVTRGTLVIRGTVTTLGTTPPTMRNHQKEPIIILTGITLRLIDARVTGGIGPGTVIMGTRIITRMHPLTQSLTIIIMHRQRKIWTIVTAQRRGLDKEISVTMVVT